MSRNVSNNAWLSRICATAAVVFLLLGAAQPQAREAPAAKPALPAQTDVDRAVHLFDKQGVPLLKIAGLGEQRHPAWVALYALAYAGVDAYEKPLAGIENRAKFAACISWLSANLKQSKDGQWVWQYGFDSTYNDVSVKAPWASAFAQATGIQALLAAWRGDHRQEHLDLALKASKALFVPLADGGFLFRRGDDIWFEEIPAPVDNPSHILNGHMRVLLALKELADATGDKEVLGHYQRGKETLLRWLPQYDGGYWLRYDLNPRKQDLLFRIVNPYGFDAHSLAVNQIVLRDPVSGKSRVLDLGETGDASGALRIAGVHWGQPEQVEGHSVRRLVPAAVESGSTREQSGPHSYFYLSLPDEWLDNLRQREYELEIDYLDDEAANLTVQQRSIAPGPEFRDMRDGDLHLTGEGKWRRWKIPLRVTDLGWWVGESYAEKHQRYLASLARNDQRFQGWASIATNYRRAVSSEGKYTVPEIRDEELPVQTPMLAMYSMDADGVVLQHTEEGKAYHPYVLSDQLLSGGKALPGNAVFNFDKRNLKREPALRWFLKSSNQHNAGDATTFRFDFRNVYNDVVSAPPWASAFTQAYILKALAYAQWALPVDKTEVLTLARRVANSYAVSTSDGGVSSYDRAGLPFFEEVPNDTHVLNAHLISINELADFWTQTKNRPVLRLVQVGTEGLRGHLHQFDTGYWLRYDQNPRKELLFQLDWLDGQESPLIESILLRNPATRTQVSVSAGSRGAFDGSVRISGADWLPERSMDGRLARGFRNGYNSRKEAVKGGARHNVFFIGRLPSVEFPDDFDVPAHQFVVRYKDISAGRLSIKIQAIHEGNSLQFVPLRGGVVAMTGDQQWKEAIVTVRPQDLGWYKGPDYQVYEVEQLRRIADLTGDWFFSQYAERHEYFLRQQKAGRSAIIEPNDGTGAPVPRLSLLSATPTYPNHGFDNALDGDATDDYVAGIESDVEAVVKLALTPATSPKELRIAWENANNYAAIVKVYASSAKDGKEVLIGDARVGAGPYSRIPIKAPFVADSVRVVFSGFAGQPRLLLRLLEIR